MKTFWFSLGTMLLMVGAILANAACVRHITDEMYDALQSLPPCEQTSEEAQDALEYWNDKEHFLQLSVSSTDMTEMEKQLTELCVAAQLKDEEAFEQARALCLLELSRIRDLERFSLFHIL